MKENLIKATFRDPLDDKYKSVENSQNDETSASKAKEQDIEVTNEEDLKETLEEQNREFRTRLDAATQYMQELKDSSERKLALLQEQVDQLKRQNQNLQTSNAALQNDNKQLKSDLSDKKKLAAETMASEIVKQASEFSDMTKQKAKTEASQYREKTISQAEAQAHEIRHDADEYANQAKERAHNSNAEYNEAKENMQNLVANLQNFLSNAEDIPDTEIAKTQEKKQSAKNNKTSQNNVDEVHNKTNVSNLDKDNQVANEQTNSKVVPLNSDTSSDNNSTTRAFSNKPKVSKLLSNDVDMQKELNKNSASIQNFDAIIQKVAHNRPDIE